MVKETNVNLNNYMGKTVTVKLNGNRRVEGILRGYDQMMNIVWKMPTKLLMKKTSTKWEGW